MGKRIEAKGGTGKRETRELMDGMKSALLPPLDSLDSSERAYVTNLALAVAGRLQAVEDDSPPEPEPCSICHGFGWVRRSNEARVGDPGFGKAAPCPGCKGPEIEQRRIAASLKEAGIPGHFGSCTFDSYRQLPFADVDAADMVEEWLAEVLVHPKRARSLLLIGPIGAGKTGAGVSAFRVLLRDCDDFRVAAFVRTVDLFTRIGNAIDMAKAGRTPPASEAEIVVQMCEVPLLFLDDVASERWTDYREEKLFQILGYRHDHEKLTIITSNKKIDELTADDGPLGARTASRLIEMCRGYIIEFVAPDIRLI